MSAVKILHEIGKGAFSKCFLALDNNNEYVALKKSIYQEKYEGVRYSELREIYCLLKLRIHPNIIPIKEFFFDNDKEINIIFKYVSRTLKDFIHEFPLETRLTFFHQIIQQLLSAIHFIHSNNIIHTDLKSSNILISKNRNKVKIYIIDFGSSQVEGVTERYSVVTTYPFRAPEVFRYDNNYSYNIDIWSLGMVLYNYLFRKNYLEHRIFKEKTDAEKIQHIKYIDEDLENNIKDEHTRFFIKKCLIFDEYKRPNIFELINIYELLHNTTIKTINPNKINKNYDLDENIKNKLISFNLYIDNNLFLSKINDMNYCYYLASKYQKVINKKILTNDELVIIWYISYQLVNSNVDYTLYDLLPLFGIYLKKRLYNYDFCDQIYDFLAELNFEIY